MTPLAPLPVFNGQELREMLTALQATVSGTKRSVQSLASPHRVVLASHELEALLTAARVPHPIKKASNEP